MYSNKKIFDVKEPISLDEETKKEFKLTKNQR